MSSPDLGLASTHLAISWFNSLLYMLEITLAVYYFSRFTVSRSLKVLLYGILLADFLCMIAIYASAWMLLIHDTSQTYSSDSLWTVPVSTIMATILAVTEELFLIDRCRKLSQPVIVTAVLLAMVLSHAILNLYSGLYVVSHSDLDPNTDRYGNTAAAVFACLAATINIFIPLALTWQLYIVTPAQISKQRSWLDTIINAISSGCIGGIMSVVLLILFWTEPDLYYVLVNTMGRVYAITLLVNLLVSKRKYSHHVLDVAKKPRNSASTQHSLVTFTITRAETLSKDGEKQLPPTPEPEEV